MLPAYPRPPWPHRLPTWFLGLSLFMAGNPSRIGAQSLTAASSAKPSCDSVVSDSASLTRSVHRTCAPPSSAPEERQVSWKLLVPNIVHDQKPIWLFPVHFLQGEHVKPTLSVTFGTAGLVALDPHDAPYFRRTSSFTDFNQAFSGSRTGVATAIFPISFYVVGLARHDTYAQHTALLSGEAAADVEILMAVMKGASRRLRPSDIAPNGDFTHTWFKAQALNGSFPSGHTIAAFAIATVFADRYSRHRWVPWVAYGLAAFVGFSRLPLRAHFPSDVFAGAVLGYAVGHYDVLRR